MDSIQITPDVKADTGAASVKTGEPASLPGGTASTVKLDSTQTPTTPSAPEVPEKFRKADGSLDSDKLLASYRELETKNGKPADKAVDNKPIAEAPKALSADDMAKLNTEFATSGALSDETYKSLAGKGLSKDLVDTYIAGQQARANEYTNSLRDHVGGKDSLDSILEWAGKNLTKAQIDNANKALSSGDAESAKLVLDGLQSRYTKAVGKDPALLTGEGSLPNGVKPFASNNEIVEAMSDPRYKRDPAYRAKVEERFKVSK